MDYYAYDSSGPWTPNHSQHRPTPGSRSRRPHVKVDSGSKVIAADNDKETEQTQSSVDKQSKETDQDCSKKNDNSCLCKS